MKSITIRSKVFKLGFYQAISVRPSLKGPGYECEPAFPQNSVANIVEVRNAEYEIDDREDIRYLLN